MLVYGNSGMMHSLIVVNIDEDFQSRVVRGSAASGVSLGVSISFDDFDTKSWPKIKEG